MTEKDMKNAQAQTEDAGHSREMTSEEQKSGDPLEETHLSEQLDPVAVLTQKLGDAETAAAEARDRYVRLYAEFENYKKRSSRENQDFRKYANEYLVRDILPVVDNLDRAIASSSADGGSDADGITKGVQLTYKEILRILEKFHVRPITSLGEKFDPRFHEAIGQEPSDSHADNTVIKELQKGYLLHDRLLRPAMVIVSKAFRNTAAEKDEPVIDGEAGEC